MLGWNGKLVLVLVLRHGGRTTAEQAQGGYQGLRAHTGRISINACIPTAQRDELQHRCDLEGQYGSTATHQSDGLSLMTTELDNNSTQALFCGACRPGFACTCVATARALRWTSYLRQPEQVLREVFSRYYRWMLLAKTGDETRMYSKNHICEDGRILQAVICILTAVNKTAGIARATVSPPRICATSYKRSRAFASASIPDWSQDFSTTSLRRRPSPMHSAATSLPQACQLD